MIIILLGIKIRTCVVAKSITFIKSQCQMISITVNYSYNIKVCVIFFIKKNKIERIFNSSSFLLV